MDSPAGLARLAAMEAQLGPIAADVKELLARSHRMEYLPAKVDQLDADIGSTRHALRNLIMEQCGLVRDELKGLCADLGERVAFLETGERGRGGQSKLIDRFFMALGPLMAFVAALIVTHHH